MTSVHSPYQNGVVGFLAGHSPNVFHRQIVHIEYNDLHMRTSKLDRCLKVEEHTS